MKSRLTLDLHAARIMIVDDHQANVTLLEKMLRSRGYTAVEGYTDPHAAVARYPDWRPDLVLLDLNMPGMDGFAVMKALAEFEPDGYPPVLVVTAQAEVSIRLQALQAGARDFLNKPFDIDEALARVTNLLEVRLLHSTVLRQNEVLEAKVRERTRELNESRLEVIRRLGRAAEYRDNETGLHILRMSHYSAALASALGMSAMDIEMILNASPMHDIGKIGIPDRILLKPGKLDADEWRIMQTHSAIGYEILSGHDSDLMQLAAQIAITHHEKWDGSGYPNGLAGNEIPLPGRIVAICDVFDALTTVRPYKTAWSIERTLDFMRAERETHFDPELVDHFFDLLPEILTIRERYAEPAV